MKPSQVEVTSVPVSKNWQRFIYYCKNKMPHGDITLRVAGGEPVELLKETPKVRFDKGEYFPDLT